MTHATLARKAGATTASQAKTPSQNAPGNLRIGEPNDAFEQEADRVADRVMSAEPGKLDWSLSKMSSGGPLQRQCTCGGKAGSSGECDECREKKLQRKVVIPDSGDQASVMATGLAVMPSPPMLMRQSSPQSTPKQVQPVPPTEKQKDVITASLRSAAVRTQLALFQVRGTVPPGPSRAPDSAKQAQVRSRNLARTIFGWDNPNMEQIEGVLSSMVNFLRPDLDVKVAGAKDPECGPLREAYEIDTTHPLVMCPAFFGPGTNVSEHGVRTMIHESAHLAGIRSTPPEGYCVFFDCASQCPGGFDSADSWAHFVHCLSGQTPDVPDSATQGQPKGAQSPSPAPGVQRSLQRKSGSAPNETQKTPEAPSIIHEVLRSPGRPLDAGTRAFMEPRFGHDFSQVRVHADARAADSARAVRALAYTVGNDIVFAPGQLAGNTSAGRRLMAHELTHVIQQGGSPKRESDRVSRVEQERPTANSCSRVKVSFDENPMVRRVGWDASCNAHLAPEIRPGHKAAQDAVDSAIAMLKQEPFTKGSELQSFFGKGAATEQNRAAILANFIRIRKALDERYAYHCEDKNTENDNSAPCHGNNAVTATESQTRDITLCFGTKSFWGTPENLGLGWLIIHENVHRAMGVTPHLWNPTGGLNGCLGPKEEISKENVVLDNPDSYSCFAMTVK